MASLPYPRSHQTIFPQKPQNPQKPLAEISSHRCHRCSQIFLTGIFSHGLHRTHRILAPSMCNCRRVWHPCHTHAPYQGVHLSQVHQPSSHCILPQNSPNSQKPLAEISSHRRHRCAQIFLAEIFSHGLHRTRRILVPSLCNYRRVWHPCHTHAPYQGVHLSQVHQPSSHCILPQNSPNSQKPLAEISSHRRHRCAQIFLAEIFSHGLHRTRRILVPSLCNYRRVWHPAIPTQTPNYLPTEATEPYAA